MTQKRYHKSLLPLPDGQLIVERIVQQLSSAGILDVVFVSFFPPVDELLVIISEACKQYNVRPQIVHQDPIIEYGTIFSAFRGCDVIKNGDDILLVEGDVVCKSHLIPRLVEATGSLALIDNSVCMDEEPMAVECSNGYALRFGKNIGRYAEFCGIIRIAGADVQAFVRACKEVSRPNGYYEEALNLMLAEGWKLRTMVIPKEDWVEVDTPEDMEEMRQLWARWGSDGV